MGVKAREDTSTNRCFSKENTPVKDQRLGVKGESAAPGNFKAILKLSTLGTGQTV